MFPISKAAALACGLCALLAGEARAQKAEPFALHDGDRIVFYGDSITDQRLYTTYVENYVVTRFPKLKVQFIHSGWGGDSVRGGGGGPIDVRLERDVLAYKPTVMTIMLGMNDAGYHAFDQPTFDAYAHGYEHILDTVRKRLPGIRLTLIGPSPYDDVTQPPKFDGGYNGVLVHYGDYVKGLADKNGLGFTDFNAPMNAMLAKANAADPATAKQIIADRVHPGPAGHLVMAEQLLKAWNATSVVSAVEIDAAGQRVAKADNCRIEGLKAGDAIVWKQTDDALPFPGLLDGPTTDLVLKSSDFTQALDQETLSVTGLKPDARYVLKIDGLDVAEFDGQQLAAGINLATLPTPMEKQAEAVAALTAQHNDMHFNRWRTIQVPLLHDATDKIKKALPPLLAALDDKEAKVVAQQHTAAIPVSHSFEIVPTLPDPTGPNLAQGKSYDTSAPNKYGYGMGGLTDGSYEASGQHTFATDDATDTFPKTATIDLGAATSVGAVRVGVPPFGSTKTVEVSVSADGTTFTPVGRYAFSQRHEERHLYKFPPVTARYVRLTYLDHYNVEADFGNYFMFTTEAEVFAP